MRASLLIHGLLALVLLQPSAHHHKPVDENRAIPRFILHKDHWICVDRNPRQLNRQDCLPKQM